MVTTTSWALSILSHHVTKDSWLLSIRFPWPHVTVTFLTKPTKDLIWRVLPTRLSSFFYGSATTVRPVTLVCFVSWTGAAHSHFCPSISPKENAFLPDTPFADSFSSGNTSDNCFLLSSPKVTSQQAQSSQSLWYLFPFRHNIVTIWN